MPLVAGNSLLLDAKKRGYAIPQFNVLNLEMVDAVITTAESLSAPVIVGIVDRHFPALDVESLIFAVKTKAEKTNVPIILHLDHGRTWERVMEAIRLGFTSVMYDGSLLPIEENIRMTKDITKCAHAVGVSVEAELGHVGSGKRGDGNEITSIEDAVYFVEMTDVDYLAISIGNTHGHQKTPTLQFDVLEEINEKVQVPLVLHGGSDISKEDMHKLILGGISKVNIFSEFAKAYMEGTLNLSTRNNIDYLDLTKYGKENARGIIKEKLETFQTVGKCTESILT